MTVASRVPRFRANVAATLAGRLGAMAVALVFATLLSRWIGLARYGTWSVFAAFLGFSSVLDFGLVVAVERAVAQADAAGDRARLPHLLYAGRTLALLLGIVLFALAGAALMLLPDGAWASIGDPTEARQAALVLPIAFTLNLQAAVWAAALTGLRRSAEAHLLRVAGTALAALLTLATVWQQAVGVRGMLLVYSAVIFATGGAVAWRVHTLVGAAHWPRWPGRWDGAAARALASVDAWTVPPTPAIWRCARSSARGLERPRSAPTIWRRGRRWRRATRPAPCRSPWCRRRRRRPWPKAAPASATCTRDRWRWSRWWSWPVPPARG